MTDTKGRYLQRASLCYEIAATMTGEKVSSMVHLGDLYSDLANALNTASPEPAAIAEQAFPECPHCGSEMQPHVLLPKTGLFPARQKFHCACGEALIYRRA
jgi:hypothetical protein